LEVVRGFLSTKIDFMLKISVKRQVLSVFIEVEDMTPQQVGIVGLVS